MRWFIAAAVLCVLVIWAQIAIITKPEQVKQVLSTPAPVEAPLTPPKETAIVPPSPAAAPAQVAAAAKDAPSQLQTSVAVPAATAPAPAPAGVPPSRLAASVQSELTRLGCYNGAIDNDWNRSTRRALRRFARRAKVEIDASEATAQTVATLRGYEASENCRVVTASSHPQTQTSATESTAGQPAKDDAYLPPWMRHQPGAGSKQTSNSGTGTEPTPSASPADTADTPVAEPAAPEHKKKRRRHRHRGGGDPFTAIGNALGL